MCEECLKSIDQDKVVMNAFALTVQKTNVPMNTVKVVVECFREALNRLLEEEMLKLKEKQSKDLVSDVDDVFKELMKILEKESNKDKKEEKEALNLFS